MICTPIRMRLGRIKLFVYLRAYAHISAAISCAIYSIHHISTSIITVIAVIVSVVLFILELRNVRRGRTNWYDEPVSGMQVKKTLNPDSQIFLSFPEGFNGFVEFHRDVHIYAMPSIFKNDHNTVRLIGFP